jgi:hypothetical protein
VLCSHTEIPLAICEYSDRLISISAHYHILDLGFCQLRQQTRLLKEVGFVTVLRLIINYQLLTNECVDISVQVTE